MTVANCLYALVYSSHVCYHLHAHQDVFQEISIHFSSHDMLCCIEMFCIKSQCCT